MAHRKLLYLRGVSAVLGALPLGAGQRTLATRIYRRFLRGREGAASRVKFRGDASFEVDLSDGIQAIAYLVRRYDPELVKFIARELRPNGVFLDVGAHVGFVSFSVASESRGARIHAFEPHPRNREQFKRNRELNPGTDVRLNEVAVGDKEGSIELEAGGGSAVHHVQDGSETKTEATLAVPITTLDRYAREQGIVSIDVLKLDVEGYEGKVLDGADQLLSAGRIGCIVSEIHEGHLRRAGTDASELLGRLAGYGYVRRELPALGLHRIRRPHGEYVNTAFVRGA